METLCKIRDIYRSVIEYETKFEKTHNICLNEGMLLCSLMKDGKLSSGEIAEKLGLSLSNTSKVIKSVESKGLVQRMLGDKDKRQMYFVLTADGKQRLKSIKCKAIEVPDQITNAIQVSVL